MGSPTDPSTRSDDRSWASRCSVAPLHERADGGGGGVEDRHPVALDDRPPPVPARRVGAALVEHRRGPVGQRPVDDVAVAGDPADVGRAPVDVGVGVVVEDVLVGEGDLGEVAAGGVHDALGLGRRPRRVEQVEELLGVHGLGRAVVGGAGHEVVVPLVPALHHGDVGLGAADHHHVLDGGRVLEGDVGVGLEGDGLGPPPPAVGGDQDLGLGVVDPVAQGVGREPAEDHAVGGADAGAGEHGHRQLGDHREVDVDPVAPFDPQGLEDVGEPGHLGRELGVGDGAGVARLALPVVGDLVAPTRGHVPVEAVGGGVEGAAHEPLGEGQLPVEDRVPVGVPVEEVGRLAGPEALVVAVGLVVHRHVGDEGLLLEVLGGGEFALLEVVRLDGRPVRRLVSHDRRAYPCTSHSRTRNPPSPDGSVRAAPSVTRLRALSAAGGRRCGPGPATRPGRPPPGRRGRGPGGTRPGTGRRWPGELVDGHLAGDVGRAQVVEGMAGPAVAAVGADPVRPRPRRHRRGRVGVVEHDDPPPSEAADRRRHPRPAARSCTGMRAPTAASAGPSVARRDQHLGQVLVDEHLLPPLGRPLEQAEGEVVEQLVGQHHPVERAGRQLVHHLGPAAQPLGRHRPQRRRTLHRHVADGRRQPCPQDRRGQGAPARPCLHHRERLRPAQLLPPRHDRPRQHRAEQGPDLGTGDEVGPAPPRPPPARVEAAVGAVERLLDHLVEPQQPLGGHGPGSYFVSDARSPRCPNSCG